MSETFHCGDNPLLAGYLYGECEPAERLAIDAHIQVCAACAAELAALESTRMQLGSWAPPEAELGFQIVGGQAPGQRSREASGAGSPDPRPEAWHRRPLPAWAQAAAAVLIFGAGLAMGVARGTPAAAPVVPPAVATGAAAVTPDELAALEGRLQAEIARSQNVPEAPAAAGDARILATVRTLIEESEQRQQRELALRTAQIVRDFDSQRRVDLAQIQRTFGQIEGLTGAEVREQRQMLNYLIRASQQR